MALSNLVASLTDSRLRDFVECWSSARGDHPLPRWRDLDISLMKATLPFVWAWHLDRESGKLTGKLAGELILAVLGSKFRGIDHEQYFEGRGSEIFRPLHEAVIFDGVGIVSSGRIFSHLGSYAMGQRVMLPVSERGDVADIVFGATVYDYGAVRADNIHSVPVNNDVRYFSLE